MSRVHWYIPKEKQKNRSLNPRSNLLQKFAEKMGIVSGRSDSIAPTTSAPDDIYKQEKKKARKLELDTKKKLSEMEEGLKRLKGEKKLLSEENRRLKQKIYNERQESKESNKQLHTKVQHQATIIDSLKSEIEKLRNQQPDNNVQTLRAKNRFLGSQSTQLRQQNNTLSKQNQKLKHELYAIQQVDRNQYTALRQLMREHQATLRELTAFRKNSLVSSGHNALLPSLFETLFSRVTPNNLAYFEQIDDLYEKVRRLREETKYKKVVADQSEEEMLHEERTLFGYVLTNPEGEWNFHSIDQAVFPLKENPDELKGFTPVKVKLEGNKAVILQTYSTASRKKKLAKRRKFTRKYTKSNSDWAILKGVRVLIVGSERKNLYINRLTQLGAKPTWFDSYEEGSSILGERVKQAQLVIVCTGHSRHMVWDIASIDDPKVEALYPDTVNTLERKVISMASRLLKEGN